MNGETTAMESAFSVKGKIAVITGGAGGIGTAICRQLGSSGATVLIADVDQAGINRNIATLSAEGIKIFGYRTDSSNEDEVVALFEEIAATHGTPDILVNNAFQGFHTPPQDTPLSEWQRVIAVCLTGYFLNAREFGRRVISAQKPANIVNISSIAGSSGLGRGNFSYSVAKGGVNQMTRELAVEWARSKIRVNAIQPCSVNTPGWQKWMAQEGDEARKLNELLLSGIPLGRVAEPEDIAWAVHFLASDASSMITGVVLPVDGGNLALNAGGTVGNY